MFRRYCGISRSGLAQPHIGPYYIAVLRVAAREMNTPRQLRQAAEEVGNLQNMEDQWSFPGRSDAHGFVWQAWGDFDQQDREVLQEQTRRYIRHDARMIRRLRQGQTLTCTCNVCNDWRVQVEGDEEEGELSQGSEE